jgi:hypothetical protein
MTGSKAEGFSENYLVAVEALVFDQIGRWVLIRCGAGALEIGKLEGVGGCADESEILLDELCRETRKKSGARFTSRLSTSWK